MSPERKGNDQNTLKDTFNKTPVSKQAQTESRQNKNIIESSLKKKNNYLNTNVARQGQEKDHQKYSNPYFGSALAKGSNSTFDMENDPDRPENAINMSVIVEEIDVNGNIQKIQKKVY